jgi:flagellar L-ring protein precursor FlgH
MTTTASRRTSRFALIGALVLALPACNTAQRLSELGNGPDMTKIEDPQGRPGYTPVNLPMPKPQAATRNPNSLWRSGARAFFKDQRATRVGDLLTVLITINDKAQFNNTTTRNRDNKEKLGVPNLFGFETGAMDNIFTGIDPSAIVSAAGTTDNTGKGAIDRKEVVNLVLAAIITQVLPNGNLVMQGKQEVRVNAELRELTITGVVRPEDIDAQNRISYDKIAEARISYGGRGLISDVQAPRYGQQLFDILSPF